MSLIAIWAGLALLVLGVAQARGVQHEPGQGAAAPCLLRVAQAHGEEPLSEVQTAPGVEIVRPVGVTEHAALPGRVAHGFSGGAPVVLRDRELILVYSSKADNGLKLTRSVDGGQSWGAARVIEKNPDPQIDHHGRPAAVRLSDGTIWVFYYGYVTYAAEDPAASRSDLWGVRSDDEGATWGQRTRVWAGYTGMTSGAIQTRTGRVIIPLAYFIEPHRLASTCVVSDGADSSWRVSETVTLPDQADAAIRARGIDAGAQEPSVVELKDGRILMMLRTWTGRLWQCHSADGGLTWSEPSQTALDCGGTQYLTRLSSGRLILVWNRANPDRIQELGIPLGFETVSVALSDDEGETWARPVRIAHGVRMVHSLVVEPSPGELLITLPQHPLLLRCREAHLLEASH